MDERLGELEREFGEVADRMADPSVAGRAEAYKELATRYAELQPVVNAWRSLERVRKELGEAREVAAEKADAELAQLARTEAEALCAEQERLEKEITSLLLPRDPNDEKNVILEVRAGTGGNEATLFAAELFRMYERFAEANQWTFEVVDVSASDVGGIKEGIANISGKNVFARLKFESGVHRVQRVPATESQGRVHTSAATVAILPEAEDVEVEIDEGKDLRLDSFSASGPGGQHVNRTASAVRVTHIPTGIVVQCQDEKSWHKNKAKAMTVLRARLYDRLLSERQRDEVLARRGQIGTGDRSEKIRTYNYPQNRVTDHRIGLTLHRLEQIVEGELGELIDALAEADRSARLRAEAGS